MTSGQLAIGAGAVAAALFLATMNKPWGARPVPLPVSATISHFAPGLSIGGPVEQSAPMLRGMQWRQSAGYHGALRADRGFTHARLIPSPRELSKPAGDLKASVWAVELVAERSDSIPNVMIDLGIAFRGSPRDGCILPSVEGMPRRRVQYWSTRSDAGGVALITDWGEGRHTGPSNVVVWSIFAWAGPFEGAKTLFANYDPRSCLALEKQSVAGAPDAVSTAGETLQLAWRDSLNAEEEAAASRVAAAREPLIGGEQPDACSLGVQKPAETHATTLFEIDLPTDFTLKNREAAERTAQATGYARYEWSANDGTTFAVFAADPASVHRGWTGLVESECDIESVSGPMHIDVANASVSRPDRVVHAALEVPGRQSLMVLAHARSIERQRELVRAARSVRVSPHWGH